MNVKMIRQNYEKMVTHNKRVLFRKKVYIDWQPLHLFLFHSLFMLLRDAVSLCCCPDIFSKVT